MRNFIIGFVCCLIFFWWLVAAGQNSKALRDPFADLSSQEFIINDHNNEQLFIYDLLYRDTDSMVNLLKKLYPELVVAGEGESKQIVIKTNKNNFNSLYKKVRLLDRELDQILIEVKVVEVSSSDMLRLGTIWDFKSEGRTLYEQAKVYDFIDNLEVMIGNGKARIMANPKVTTMLGKEALIHIGDQVPYSVPVESASGKTSWEVKYLDAGINLSLLPLKAERGFISLNLRPEVATIKQWKLTPNGEYPIISSRKVETNLRLKDGESFIIGGLLNEEERENIRKVPLLGDIPLINILFKHKSYEKISSEILFLVTAKKV